MLTEFFIIFLLVILNGFFVAAEFALVKVRGSQVDVLNKKGSSRAKTAKTILTKLDAYLSAAQLGITLASLGLGAYGERVMSEHVAKLFVYLQMDVNEHIVTVPIAFSLITFLHITLGEQVPKMFGIKYPLETVLYIAVPLHVFYFIFSPFIWLLNKSSNLFLRMLGIKKTSDDEVHTEEELRLILTESEVGGAIKPSENELIQNVFDFDDRFVKQIMVPKNRVTYIDIEALDKDGIVRKITEEGFSRYPIYLGDIDNIIGVIYAKDLFKAIISLKFNTIKEIMRPAHFIPESMKVNDLLRDFQKLHIQIAIVTNEFGATAGIVTMEDIIEELVGEIQDEHDEETPIVEKKSEYEYIVNAQANITDINESLPMSFPENEKYETISGLINYLWGRIPGTNEKREYEGYEITILKRKKQNVESVKLRVLEVSEEN